MLKLNSTGFSQKWNVADGSVFSMWSHPWQVTLATDTPDQRSAFCCWDGWLPVAACFSDLHLWRLEVNNS